MESNLYISQGYLQRDIGNLQPIIKILGNIQIYLIYRNLDGNYSKKWNLNAPFLWQHCWNKSAINKPKFQNWINSLCLTK